MKQLIPLMEDDTNKEAEAKGLKYAGYGYWEDMNGKKVARTQNGKLVMLKPTQNETEVSNLVVPELNVDRERDAWLRKQGKKEGRDFQAGGVMEQDGKLQDLGYANHWKSMPPEIEKCRAKGHRPYGKNLNSRGTEQEFWCDKCGYKYRVDSSD